jgi:hypothetical protein
MPEHVTVNWEGKTCPLANALDKTIDGVRREWPAPFGREYECCVGKLAAKLPERSDFIAPKRMNGRLAILGASDVQRCRPAELDLRPLQVGYLDGPAARAGRRSRSRLHLDAHSGRPSPS